MGKHAPSHFLKKTVFAPLFFAAIFGLLPFAEAQNNRKIDSLYQVLDTSKNWQTRVDVHNGLADKFQLLKPDSAISHANLASAEAEKHNYKIGKVKSERFLGWAKLYKGQFDESLAHIQKSLEISRETGDKMLLAQAYHDLSQIYYFGFKRLGEAVENELLALEIYTELRDSVRMSISFSELGLFLSRQNRIPEAIKYGQKSLEFRLKTDKNIYSGYARLSQIFGYANLPDSAFFYCQKALEFAKIENKPANVMAERANLATHFVRLKKYGLARQEFLAFLNYSEEIKNRPNIIVALINLAELENITGNYPSALNFAQKALNLIGNSSDFYRLESLHRNLSSIYENMGDYKNAFLSAQNHAAMRDSLTKKERTDLLAESETKYRSREQETTIAQQNLQLERQQNRNQLLVFAALFALLAGAGFAFFLREKRRRAELALRLEKSESDKLRELDSVKSAFFANISHEFRTPLTLLLGPLQEMEAGTFRGDAKKYFPIMRRNASRLLQLVNQMLDLSRLENGKLKLQNAPGDLHRMLRAVAGSFESLAATKQIDFKINIPAAPFFVNFDADKLEKIAANLLSNAFKFTPEEGRVIFEISTSEISGKTEIGVSDSGIGIAAEQVTHIFERFYQVENSGADLQPGSGIGLALTKELVELQGGKIEVQSIENQGTTFTASFDFEKTKPAEASVFVEPKMVLGKISTPILTSNLNGNLNGKSPKTAAPLVLVAEDNPDVRAYIVEYLQEKYQILEAKDGQEALELATENIPDLILTDLMMPILNGTELTKKLKNDVRTHHIPVVMLTAKSGRDDKISGIETGAEAYLTKPFDGDELRAVLQNLLAQRKILQEKYSRQIRLDAPKTEAVSLDDQFLQKVLAEIEENLNDETFGVEPLAASVAMSRSNLFRKLDALLGKSPNQLIRERRLLRAKLLLEQGAGNSTEVAFMTGFNSPSYFAKCFQEMFGVQPGAVARKMREEMA